MMKNQFYFCWLALAWTLLATSTLSAQHRGYQTENFVVYSSDRAFAEKVGAEAERFRKELAEKWLGHELEPWQNRCPIQVRFDPHAGGETSFGFVNSRRGKGQPFDWSMKIFGPPDRLLDSVLPHEVTHTIFATHFGCPLPRWADEGACTTVEHRSEKNKSQDMLIQFLKTRRGIPFNQMFVMREYPTDILPLYAQGHSVAQFLIQKNGCRHFVDFVGYGMDLEQSTRGRKTVAWDKAISEFYGFTDLSDLQVTWTSWVAAGSPAQQDRFVSNEKRGPVQLNQPIRPMTVPSNAIQNSTVGFNGVPDGRTSSNTNQLTVSTQSRATDGWYLQQASQPGSINLPSSQDLVARDSAVTEYRPGSIKNAPNIEILTQNSASNDGNSLHTGLNSKQTYSTSRQSLGRQIVR